MLCQLYITFRPLGLIRDKTHYLRLVEQGGGVRDAGGKEGQP